MLQWIALALAALRVPLAAGYPQPAEFQAVRLLLATQFAAAAMLFPLLCRNWQTTLTAIASGCVMLLAGGFLADWQPSWAAPACGLLALWLLALAVWRAALPSPYLQAIAAAVLTLWSVGGALLWYFQLELNPDGAPAGRLSQGPLIGALIDPRSPGGSAWACVAVLLAAGALGGAVRLGVIGRARISGP